MNDVISLINNRMKELEQERENDLEHREYYRGALNELFKLKAALTANSESIQS
jgi:hypothetical protein